MARQRLERSGKWFSRRQTTNYLAVKLLTTKQTSRVWDFSTGETKMELRGHEHVVECAVFAPLNAYPAIRELAGLKVSLLYMFIDPSLTTWQTKQPPAPGDTRAKSPGVYVATGSRDKTVKLWDALSGQCLRTFVRRRP